MTSEVKNFKSQISIYTIRVYMHKIASLSVFIKVWPQLAIFDLKWPLMTSEVKLTQQNVFLSPIWVYMQKIVALGLDVKELPYFEVFDL